MAAELQKNYFTAIVQQLRTCDASQWWSTRSSAIAEGLRDASCQLNSCQLPRNSAETTCTTLGVIGVAEYATKQRRANRK